MCITRACEEPTSPGVWWRDDAEWKQYDAATAAAILRGLNERANRVKLGPLVSSKHARGAKYLADLSTMKQINLATGFTRDVKVVNAPAPPVNAGDDLASVKEEVRVCQESIKSLKETVVKLQADLLAVKLAASRNEAIKVSANVTSANHWAPIRLPEDDYWLETSPFENSSLIMTTREKLPIVRERVDDDLEIISSPPYKKVRKNAKSKPLKFEEDDNNRNWLDSEVEALIALKGEMQPEFTKNTNKQGVDMWLKLHSRLLCLQPNFKKTPKACKDKFNEVHKTYTDDKQANSISEESFHTCKF